MAVQLTTLSALANDSTLADGAVVSHSEHNTHRTNYRSLINNLRLAATDLENNYASASEPADKPDGKHWYDSGNTVMKARISSAWETMVGLTQTQTLTNKTLTSPKIAVIVEAVVGAGVAIDGALIHDGRAPFPRGWISGLVPSRDTDTTNDINITAGEARDSTNAYNIIAASEITKKMDVNWAEGNDQGGVTAGATWGADTWHVFLIGKTTDDSAYDYIIDDNLAGTNISADVSGDGYDIQRRVYSQKTGGAAWGAYHAVELKGGGLCVRWDVTVRDYSQAEMGTSRVVVTTSGPADLDHQAKAFGSWELVDSSPGGNTSMLVTEIRQTDTAASATVRTAALIDPGTGDDISVYFWTEDYVSTTSTIGFRVSNSDEGVTVRYYMHGWCDDRLL